MVTRLQPASSFPAHPGSTFSDECCNFTPLFNLFLIKAADGGGQRAVGPLPSHGPSTKLCQSVRAAAEQSGCGPFFGFMIRASSPRLVTEASPPVVWEHFKLTRSRSRLGSVVDHSSFGWCCWLRRRGSVSRWRSQPIRGGSLSVRGYPSWLPV